MQSLFSDTRILDKAARERYGLTEELMMENAAAALERAVIQSLLQRAEPSAQAGKPMAGEQRVVVLCGSGNNGADGYALSRRLAGFGASGTMPIVPVIVAVSEPKSDLCKLQAERAKKCGVECIPADAVCTESEKNNAVFESAAVIVDCIFGSGFHGDLDEKTARLCVLANDSSAMRIACDVPTGLREDGTISSGAFCADCTVTMGALKCSLYSDAAKDVVGPIICENLGVSRALFEAEPAAAFLLEESDLVLPHREKNVVNKGSFGHAAVASGEKIGTSCIAGEAALHFGAGLVSLVRLGTPFEKAELPQVTPELMTASDFPANTTAVALGMGLGRADEVVQPYLDWLSAHKNIPCVIDADACFCSGLAAFLHARAERTVLTPHPKEFQFLLQNVGLGDYTIDDCVNRRPALVEKFCRAFPQAVLLVKGANPMIGTFDGERFYLFVNPLGTNALAKAGSGDVLAGLISALLAQGRTALDATIHGSIAHALASRKCKSDYSLTPLALIAATAEL